MAFEVPPLPYDYAALEPHIDEETMQVHHDKHHQAYVDKANAALEGTEWADKSDRGGPQEPRRAARRQAEGRSATTAAATTTTRCSGSGCRPDGGGEPDGDAGRGDQRRVRLVRRLQGEVQGRRRQPVRLRLGVARPRRLRPGGRRARRTRTPRCRPARRRCWAPTCGSTPTTSSTRTSARTTSTRSGTSSTGARSPSCTRAATVAPRRNLRPVAALECL